MLIWECAGAGANPNTPWATLQTAHFYMNINVLKGYAISYSLATFFQIHFFRCTEIWRVRQLEVGPYDTFEINYRETGNC